jgi:hypothetical protein
MAAAWAEVLGISEDEVPMQLGRVAVLLEEVRQAAEDTGEAAYAPMPAHLRTLSGSIIPVTQNLNSAVTDVLPDGNAMDMLNTLAAFLRQTAPEGERPEHDDVEELRATTRGLMEDVAAAELPPEIRRELLRRLGEVLEALDHLGVGGPNAVRRAAEALALSAMLYESAAQGDQTVFTRAKVLAKRVAITFTVATTMATGALTWDKIIDLPVIEQGEQPRQLPRGPSSESDDSSPSEDEDATSVR